MRQQIVDAAIFAHTTEVVTYLPHLFPQASQGRDGLRVGSLGNRSCNAGSGSTILVFQSATSKRSPHAQRARIGTDAWSGHVDVPSQVRPEQWPAVDADALPEARRTQFLRRKTGIVLYFNGASEADIRAACGFGRSHIYRLITERCLAQHPDGNVTRPHRTQLRLKLGHISCVSGFDRMGRIFSPN